MNTPCEGETRLLWQIVLLGLAEVPMNWDVLHDGHLLPAHAKNGCLTSCYATIRM